MNSPEDRPRELVSAASGHGSTTEIARVIGDTLANNRIAVDIVAPAVVDSVGDYDAVILGSAIYACRWLAPARNFAIRFRDSLAAARSGRFPVGRSATRPGSRSPPPTSPGSGRTSRYAVTRCSQANSTPKLSA